MQKSPRFLSEYQVLPAVNDGNNILKIVTCEEIIISAVSECFKLGVDKNRWIYKIDFLAPWKFNPFGCFYGHRIPAIVETQHTFFRRHKIDKHAVFNPAANRCFPGNIMLKSPGLKLPFHGMIE